MKKTREQYIERMTFGDWLKSNIGSRLTKAASISSKAVR